MIEHNWCYMSFQAELSNESETSGEENQNC